MTGWFQALVGFWAILAVAGCGTMHSARPLDAGEHAMGVTLGGPMVQFSGAYIPLPNLNLEGKSGLKPLLDRPLDVNYGMNLTGLAFGIVGLHGGLSWQLVEENKVIPAITVGNRLWVNNNFLDLSKEWGDRRVWVVDQLEFTFSYALGRHLVYFGLAQYLDFAQPDLLLTPFVGTEIQASKRLALQIEIRHFALNKQQSVQALTWLSPGTGALGLNLGFKYALKKGK